MSLLKNRDSYLENLLVKGNYDKAMDYICDFSKEDVFSRLSAFAQDEQHLAVYSFSRYMYDKTLCEEWQLFILTLAITDLVAIAGMNYIGIYHARELVNNNRTVQNLSLLLEMNFCPDTCDLITKSESTLIAQEILQYDETDRVANAYMDQLNEKDTDEDTWQASFEKYLEMGLYEKALEFLEENNAREICLKYAEEQQSIEIYSFVHYMINKTKSIKWLKIAVDVLTIGLESLKTFGVSDVAAFYIGEIEKKCIKEN